VELEALYDKLYLSPRKQVEFFGDILSRIQWELETRELYKVQTKKLFAIDTLRHILLDNNAVHKLIIIAPNSLLLSFF
jgi:hypothetical protein